MLPGKEKFPHATGTEKAKQGVTGPESQQCLLEFQSVQTDSNCLYFLDSGVDQTTLSPP